MNARLQAGGYVSQLAYMASTDTRVELERLLSDSENQLAAARQSEKALTAQRGAYVQKWHGDVGDDLVTTRNDLDLTRGNLEKAQKLNDLTAIVAPEDAIVLSIGKSSTNAIMGGQPTSSQASDPLFTLMPADAPLVADIRVPTSDIGFIRTGDPATIKLDAFPFMRFGTAKGVIKTISDGSFTTDPTTNAPVRQPYFDVRVAITEMKLHHVPKDARISPGQTLIADIKVGRRTILSYIVEGAFRNMNEGMREP
jgi:HlyD family type I secretion membrane fusion protein